MSNPFTYIVKPLCILTCLMTISVSSAREFTNKKGQKINADIVSVKGDKVNLKKLSNFHSTNNKTYTIEISTLSESDQNYITNWKAENEKPNDGDQKDKDSTNKPQNTVKYYRLSYETLKKQYNIEDNFDNEWPKLSNTGIPEIKIVKEDKETNEFVYESENYQFTCDVKLSKNVVKKFAHLFEATRNYCKIIPISMIKARLPAGSYKYKILLFETKKSYVKNGGPANSAGVYMPSKDIIMVPLTSLGVKKVGSNYMFDYDGSNLALPHEITHQLTNPEYFNARGWFSEGLAEYIAATNYRAGKYMIKSNANYIKRSVTGFSRKSKRGRDLGTELSAPNLKDYMTMPYSEFIANGNFNYGLGLLITYYFFHYEKETGRDNINAFLKALNEGKQGKEALKLLLNSRTFDELEKDISKAWKSRGVTINFK